MSEHWLSDLSLVGVESKRIKSLVGFRQGHRMPDEKSAYTDAFIGRIAEPELQDDLETLFGAVRDAYGLKRREMTKDGPASGQGMLVTPAFDYVASISVSEQDATQYVFERRITNVRDLTAIVDGPFDQVFGAVLSSVEVVALKPIDVEAVIDAIEDADPDELLLDYNADATECRVQPLGTNTRIVLTADGLTVHDVGRAPSMLLQTAVQFRSQFVDDGADFVGRLT